VAFAVQQFGQAAQRRRATVGVGIPAQLTQPQHGPGRDPGFQPRHKRGSGRRILQRPVRKPACHRLIGGARLASASLATNHDQPAAGHLRVQHQPQQLIMRPAHIHRHRPVRPAARHRVHTQLGRLPPPGRAGICHHKHILTPGDESVSPNWTFCTQHTIHPRGGRWGRVGDLA